MAKERVHLHARGGRTACRRRLDFRLGGNIFRNGDHRIEVVDDVAKVTCHQCLSTLRPAQ